MELPTLLLADDDVVKIAMIGGLLIAMISIIFSFVRRMYTDGVRGKTQREIAAYVAEGSMTSEEGERLMRAANEPAKEPD